LCILAVNRKDLCASGFPVLGTGCIFQMRLLIALVSCIVCVCCDWPIRVALVTVLPESVNREPLY